MVVDVYKVSKTLKVVVMREMFPFIGNLRSKIMLLNVTVQTVIIKLFGIINIQRVCTYHFKPKPTHVKRCI
jgi:hypothetical protein